jgi:hypothetical protein
VIQGVVVHMHSDQPLTRDPEELPRRIREV